MQRIPGITPDSDSAHHLVARTPKPGLSLRQSRRSPGLGKPWLGQPRCPRHYAIVAVCVEFNFPIELMGSKTKLEMPYTATNCIAFSSFVQTLDHHRKSFHQYWTRSARCSPNLRPRSHATAALPHLTWH